MSSALAQQKQEQGGAMDGHGQRAPNAGRLTVSPLETLPGLQPPRA